MNLGRLTPAGQLRRRLTNPSPGSRGARSLGHPNFRRYFLGQTASVIGTRMHVIGQGWLVLTLTGDPFALGVVTAAAYGPVLVLGLFGGLIADRVPKREVLVVAKAAEGILALMLFGLTIANVVEFWHIIMLAGALGFVAAVETPTRHSFVIEMVGREDVSNAIALNVSAFNVARFVGPAAAGLIIASVGTATVFLINALTFIGVIVALLGMQQATLSTPPRALRPANARAIRDDLAEGLGYVRRTPRLLTVIATLAAVSIFGFNFEVLGPPLARDVLVTDASGFGFLMSGFGVGALAAALGIAFLGTRTAVLAMGAIGLGLSEVVIAHSHVLTVSIGLMMIAGLAAIGMGTTGNLTLQLEAPDHLRGRVISLYAVVFDGTAPIGGLLMGAIASNVGVTTALVVGGVLSAIIGLAALIVTRRLPPLADQGAIAGVRPA